jgi:hypothetical protein
MTGFPPGEGRCARLTDFRTAGKMLKKCTERPQNRHDFSTFRKSVRKSVRIGPKTDTFSALPGKSPSGFKKSWQNLHKNHVKKAASPGAAFLIQHEKTITSGSL